MDLPQIISSCADNSDEYFPFNGTDFGALIPNIVGGGDDKLHSRTAEELYYLFANCSVQGYLTEYQRMLNINVVCGHNSFNSKDEFCDFVIKRMQSFMQRPNSATAYDLVMLHELVKDGWCASCNIRITCHLPILKMYLIERIPEYVILSTLANLYSNSLQYFQIAKHYLFQKKNTHRILFIFELLASVLNCKVMKVEQPEIYYQSVFCFGLQIVKNLGLLKNRHWKQLLINRALIETLISTIKTELLFTLISTIKEVNDNYSHSMLNRKSAITVLCYLFMQFIQKYSEIHGNFPTTRVTAKFKNDLIQIRSRLSRRMMKPSLAIRNYSKPMKILLKKKNKFVNLWISVIEVFALKMIYEMICFSNNILKSTDQNQYALMMTNNLLETRKAKTNNIQCQYATCNKTRKCCRQISKKFRKCSRCKVFLYCSKKCAKKDWKRGAHRVLCNDYI